MSDGLLDRTGAEQLLEEDIVQRPRDASLESIVQMPTWREVLVDMVYQNEIDPWNVDVAQVANKYLQTIRGMQMEDLRVPANLILASSILLRFKSDMVSLEEAPVQSQLDDFIDVDESQPISALELNWRIAPKGRMTLDDLVEADEGVMSNESPKENKYI
jgi:segregation and condensation protein A